MRLAQVQPERMAADAVGRRLRAVIRLQRPLGGGVDDRHVEVAVTVKPDRQAVRDDEAARSGGAVLRLDEVARCRACERHHIATVRGERVRLALDGLDRKASGGDEVAGRLERAVRDRSRTGERGDRLRQPAHVERRSRRHRHGSRLGKDGVLHVVDAPLRHQVLLDSGLLVERELTGICEVFRPRLFVTSTYKSWPSTIIILYL